jgi:hypothetical protein
VSVSSLSGATRADRIVISRVGINLPIRDRVLGAPIAGRALQHVSLTGTRASARSSPSKTCAWETSSSSTS